LESWPRLSRRLGARLLAKRDDVSVIGLGGNKVRKLDLILGAAVEQGVTDIITLGGLQSNHCRLTAAACARLGLGAHLFLRGDDPRARRAGNLLLDELFGASVHIHDASDYAELDAPVDALVSHLRGMGRTPLVVPLGGSTPLGTLAYVLAVRELRDQLDALPDGAPEVDRIVVAAGTGGTLSGIALGCSLFLPSTRVVGVSVSWSAARLAAAMEDYHAAARTTLGLESDLDNMLLVDDHVGAGYTIPSPRTGAAVRLLARTEGVVSDLTYTGKALEYLMTHPLGAIGSGGSTLFWHTGGSPELFARPTTTVLGAVNGAGR